MYHYYAIYPDCLTDSCIEVANDVIKGYPAPVVIRACGFQRFITRNYKIERPNGFPDYQILYITQGVVYFRINGVMKPVGPGHIVVYLPGEPQFYYYYCSDKPEVYWVHFIPETGRNLGPILQAKERCFYVGLDSALNDYFIKIIEELSNKKAEFNQLNCAYFMALLALFTRKLQNDQYNQSKHLDKCIIDTIQYINDHYRDNITIQEYSEKSGLSLSRFTRKFKTATGMSPVEYITHLRMKEAMSLLYIDDLSIKEISVIVGYDNPFYFSRIFRKVVGVPPSRYRMAK